METTRNDVPMVAIIMEINFKDTSPNHRELAQLWKGFCVPKRMLPVNGQIHIGTIAEKTLSMRTLFHNNGNIDIIVYASSALLFALYLSISCKILVKKSRPV